MLEWFVVFEIIRYYDGFALYCEMIKVFAWSGISLELYDKYIKELHLFVVY